MANLMLKESVYELTRIVTEKYSLEDIERKIKRCEAIISQEQKRKLEFLALKNKILSEGKLLGVDDEKIC